MLTTEKLTYWYTSADQSLFKDVDLEFSAGHSYAIVGRSGSGKTTMVSLLAGLDKPRGAKSSSTVPILQALAYPITVKMMSPSFFKRITCSPTCRL